jgi:hypothetical protein
MGDYINHFDLHNLEKIILKHLDNVFYLDEKIACGIDRYDSTIKKYPEVYAKYISSILKLYTLYNNPIYLKKAEKYSNYLLKLKNKRFSLYSWGLPFSFKGIPKNESYLVTTCYCGFAFLDLYIVTKKRKYLQISSKIYLFIINYLFNKDKFFNYSTNKKHNYLIINSNALLLIFLIKYSEISSEHYKQCSKYINLIVSLLITNQHKSGYWVYSKNSLDIDNIHSCFNIESLLKYYFYKNDKKLNLILKRGINYMCFNFYNNKKGLIRLRKLYSFKYVSDKQTFIRSIKDYVIKIGNFFGYFKKNNPEDNLWGYAAAIKMLSFATKFSPMYYDYLIKISNYSMNNFTKKDGFFKLNNSDNNVYIRHQAYFFEALVNLLCFVKKVKFNLKK